MHYLFLIFKIGAASENHVKAPVTLPRKLVWHKETERLGKLKPPTFPSFCNCINRCFDGAEAGWGLYLHSKGKKTQVEEERLSLGMTISAHKVIWNRTISQYSFQVQAKNKQSKWYIYSDRGRRQEISSAHKKSKTLETYTFEKQLCGLIYLLFKTEMEDFLGTWRKSHPENYVLWHPKMG